MRKLIFWIALSKILIIIACLFSGVGLMPDEAQYWTWSKELSYGYYSKPCGIAWQIASGCCLFGDTEFGVRFAGIVLSFFLSCGLFLLALRSGLDERQAFWSSIAFSFCPLGFLSGFLATTDCGYVLAWTVACYFFMQGRFLHLGICIAIGALWKWPIYAVWIPVLLFHRRLSKQLLQGLGISLLGLVPTLLWNMQHDFSTFQHVAASMNLLAPASEERGSNPLDFIGAQIALVSPVLFMLLVYSFIRSEKKSWQLQFCFWTTLLFLLVVFGISCVKKVQGNWAVAAYPTAFVLLGLLNSKRWLIGGISVSLVLLTGLFVFPGIRQNPLRQGLGWRHIVPLLLSVGYKPSEQFLFSDRYQWTSIVSFYGPEQKRAFFLNVKQLRKNQFDYWPSMKECCVGKDGWYVSFVDDKEKAVWATRNAKTTLSAYFRRVVQMAPQQLAGTSKFMVLLKCQGYKGALPPASTKY